MNIALLFGGKSGEHEVSLVSAAAIARNFDKKHKIYLIGIAKDGCWFLQDESELERVRADEKAALKIERKNPVSVVPGMGKSAFVANGSVPELSTSETRSFERALEGSEAPVPTTLSIDVVFPAVHGTFGEDGTLQGLLEFANIPYVGCNFMSSALTFDKEKTKVAWKEAGLPVVPGILMTKADTLDSKKYDAIMEKCEKEIGYPLFVKPCSAGSSNGAELAPDLRHLHFALGQAFLWDNKVLIEKAVNAREIECAVTGNSVVGNENNATEKVIAHALGEIAPKQGFYDYDTKYNNTSGADLLIPAHLDETTTEKIKSLAVKAYKAVDASGMSRVDFFIDKDSGEIYLNEINTIPGFTQISMFPKLCGEDGIPFGELIELLISQAIARFDATRKLVTSR